MRSKLTLQSPGAVVSCSNIGYLTSVRFMQVKLQMICKLRLDAMSPVRAGAARSSRCGRQFALAPDMLPAMQKQLSNLTGPLGGQPWGYVFPIGVRIVPIEVCALDQTHLGSCTFARKQSAWE
jgi:hypothetical protein